MVSTRSYRCHLPVSAGDAFAWHAQPGALQRLTPPWENVQLVRQDGSLEPGSQVELRSKIGPIWKTWLAEHIELEEGRMFRDVQREGPFAHWDHRHLFHSEGGDACTLEDRVEYRLPLGGVGSTFGGSMVRERLDRMFHYRHQVTLRDLERHARHPEFRAMNILVTGSSGLVGSALTAFLTTGGHTVHRLRRERVAGSPYWDVQQGTIDLSGAGKLDAVVHLAGEGIANKRWSEKQKQKILDSRVDGTRQLVEAIGKLDDKPSTFVCASAIGYYGDRAHESLNETSSKGDLFLSQVCAEWEAASKPLEGMGVRVANARFGVILSPQGGALAKMLTPFKLGAGGNVGNGRQWMSWIALDDVVGALHHIMATDSIQGPVNVVAPNPVTNAVFTKTLGKVLRRPTIAPLPGFVAKVVFGEMADELLLASAKVLPKVLIRTDFPFQEPDLEGALRHVLGKPAAAAAAS